MPLTTRLEIDDQTNGSNNNTWGDVTDSNLQILEQAIAGVTSISTTGGTTTLTSSQNRFPIIVITGTLVSNATINVRAAEKNWQFINSTTGAFTVTIKTPSGSGQTIGQGESRRFYCDGTNVLNADSNTVFGDQNIINGRLYSIAADNVITAASSSGYAAFLRNAAAGGVCYDYYLIGGVEFARKTVFASGEIIFSQGASGTERARFDPNGNFVVGAGSNFPNVQNGMYVSGSSSVAASAVGFVQSSSAASRVFQAQAASASSTSEGIFYSYTNTSSSTAFNHFNAQSGGSGTVFRVNGAGTIFAVNTAVQSVSDIRMKENIRSCTEGLDVINALRPVRFDYKPEFGGGKKDQLGFIAQEIEQVFPDAVDTWGESDDPNDPYRSVGPGALIPVLVKALQEASAKITALEARVATLEA
jgi:hypothetical protein